MDMVKRRVIRARRFERVPEGAERFSFGTVKKYGREKPYKATAYLWTGEAGTGRTVETEHDSEQAALFSLQWIYDQFPDNANDCVIFYGGYELMD